MNSYAEQVHTARKMSSVEQPAGSPAVIQISAQQPAGTPAVSQIPSVQQDDPTLKAESMQSRISAERPIDSSPVASRTRSRVAATSQKSLLLKLPEDLSGLSKYHVDFVKCEDANSCQSS